MTEHGMAAVTVGEELPIGAVLYHRPGPDGVPRDSGFTVLFADAPHDSDLRDRDERMRMVCLHCLIEHYPEVGPALDLVRDQGTAFAAAERDDCGEWYIEEAS